MRDITNGLREGQTPIRCAILVLSLSLSAASPGQAPDAAPQGDPPSRVARISVAQGNVSLEPSGVDSFSQAEVNYPLTAGDRVYADVDALAEVETSGVAVRMSNGADVTLASLTDAIAQFGLAQGSIHVATRDLTAPDGSRAVVEVDTPNGAILVQAPGDFRVDSYPQDDSTVVTVTSGQVEVTYPGSNQALNAGQSLRLAGANPVTADFVGLLAPDALDTFDQDRESLDQAAATADNQYVSSGTIGAEDLDQYGDWAPSPEYGVIWYPRTVAVGWIPYRNGHWCWVAPWGWTWVEYEPWGFAPFHYGRWASVNGRCGWIPGPPPHIGGRGFRPIYSPALVAFVGGGPGVSITAWFPLGPGEAFIPWYHSSPAYVNRVNVTNIYTRNPAEFRAGFTNRTAAIYTANASYANRTVATTVVPERDFAAGHSVARSQTVRLDAATREQLNQAPVLPHPLVTPTASMAAPQAAARAVPPHEARPVLETRANVRETAAPVEANTVRPRPAPIVRSESSPASTAAPTASLPRPRQQPEAAAATTPAATQRPPEQPRTLINRTEPQPVQPSFEQQRQAIERTDPGRPLGPQQIQNLRNGRPAGAAQQPEPVAHPAPARPAPKGPPK